MPQTDRARENQQPPQVVKVTPELLKALIKQGRTGSLIPSKLTFTDSGEQIIRPILLPLNH